jgi:hypothetical protein
MDNLNTQATYPFTSAEIEAVVTEKSAGSYSLGYVDEAGQFVAQYVGRADQNLGQELLYRLRISPHFQHFQFAFAKSPQAAFEQQCQAYHASGGSEVLHNRKHPKCPSHTQWACPVCGDCPQ